MSHPVAEVDKASLCFITQDSCPPEAVIRVRILDSNDNDKIQKWAKIWGPGFDLDSPTNRVTLRKDWFATLQAHRWTLVPISKRMDSITKRLLQWKVHRKRPPMSKICSVPGPENNIQYAYTLIPLSMNNMTITRWQREKSTSDLTGVVETYQVSDGSVKDFPVIMDQIHPFFVIQSAIDHFGHHLATMERPALYAQLIMIRNLWEDLLDFPSTEAEFTLHDGPNDRTGLDSSDSSGESSTRKRQRVK